MMMMMMTTRLPSQQMACRRFVAAGITSSHRHHGNNNNKHTTFISRLYFSMPNNTISRSKSGGGAFKKSLVATEAASDAATLLNNNIRHCRSIIRRRPYLSSSMTSPEELKGAMQAARRVAQQQQDDAAAAAAISYWKRAFTWYSRKLSTHPLITKSLTSAIIAALGDVLCQAAMYTTTSPATATNENDEDSKEPGKVSSSSSSSRNMMMTWLYSFWTTGWDAQCTGIFALLGFTFVAPTSHYWYEVLAKHAWTKGQSLTNISKRVFLDQFVWTPIFFVIWLASFWTLQDSTTTTTTTTTSATVAATNKHNNSDTAPTPTTETTTATSSVHKISSQLVQHLPDVMIANWILWIPAQYINFYACPVKFQVLFCNVFELVWNAYLSFATRDTGKETTTTTTATETATKTSEAITINDKPPKRQETTPTKIPPIFYSRRQTIQRRRTNIDDKHR